MLRFENVRLGGAAGVATFLLLILAARTADVSEAGRGGHWRRLLGGDPEQPADWLSASLSGSALEQPFQVSWASTSPSVAPTGSTGLATLVVIEGSSLPQGKGEGISSRTAEEPGGHQARWAAAEAPAPAAEEGGWACSSLRGTPTDWLVRGGALGYACAMQSMRNRTGEDVAYSFRAPPDNPFSMARLWRPRALANILHDHLTARSAQVADVSSFLAVPVDQLIADPITALRAISALAQLAVQQAKEQPTYAGRLLYQPKASGVLQGSEFTEFFVAAISDPAVHGMRLAPGEYQVFVPAKTDAHIRLPCDPKKPRQTPFVVDLSGSTLIFQDVSSGGFYMIECANVELRGPVTAFHAPHALPFTQATITRITDDPTSGYHWDLKIHDGYPTGRIMDSKTYREGYVLRYDGQTRQPKAKYYDAIPDTWEKLSDSTYRLGFQHSMPDNAVGDFVVIRGIYQHGVMLQRCMNVTVANLTMHNVGMFGIIDWAGHNSRLLDNTLTPYPGQIGNGEQAALLASNGDGIHSLGASFGPLIKGNTLVNLGDDGITVHGLFFLVIQADASRKTLTVAATDTRSSIAVGGQLGVYHGDELALQGVTSITAARQVASPLAKNRKSVSMPGLDLQKVNFWELTVSDWPEGFASVGFDSVVANKGHVGTGLEIKDNVVSHNRGRGLLVKAGGGTVSGNIIVNPAWWGIMVMPETAWQEADWVSNLDISANLVDANFGGIFVGLIRSNDLGSGQYPNHANVSIMDNVVVNASYAPIMVTSAQGVAIGNNTIKDCLCQPPPYGQGFTWVAEGSLIYMENVHGVSFLPDNSFINEGGCSLGNYKQPIALGKNSLSVTGPVSLMRT